MSSLVIFVMPFVVNNDIKKITTKDTKVLQRLHKVGN